MTRIKNKIPYKIKNTLAGSDYFPMTNSEHNIDGMSYEQTVSANFDAVKAFVLAGMSPEVGGQLKITLIYISELDVDVATTVNAMSPAYDVAPYEILCFKIAGHVWMLKKTNVSVGEGTTALYDGDFIDFPVSVGPAGANGANGTNGTNGTNGADGLNANMTRVSSDSLAIATSGSKTLTYTSSANLGWLNGTRLRYAYDGSNYMEGVVTSVSATSVTITVDNSKGSGTYTTWNIGIAGDLGSVTSISGVIISEVSSGTHANTSPSASGISYALNFLKEGNKIFISGSITNGTGVSLTATPLVDITNTLYYAKSGLDTVIYATLNGISNQVPISFNNGHIYLAGTVTNTQTLNFNGFYFAN